MPNLRKICLKCESTVCGERKRRRPVSRFVNPRATALAMARSVSVRLLHPSTPEWAGEVDRLEVRGRVESCTRAPTIKSFTRTARNRASTETPQLSTTSPVGLQPSVRTACACAHRRGRSDGNRSSAALTFVTMIRSLRATTAHRDRFRNRRKLSKTSRSTLEGPDSGAGRSSLSTLSIEVGSRLRGLHDGQSSPLLTWMIDRWGCCAPQ